ncbi:MAG: AraC family transcriptional regulator [Ferruginibacter sp.]
MKLYIKHMACESCKIVVKDELEKLGLHPKKVELGEVDVKEKLSAPQQKKFNNAIKKAGLELAEDKDGVLLDQIKNVIFEYVNNTEKLPTNFSTYLSKKLHHDYSSLSRYFSDMQATTIEQFIIQLKIERVKEMIVLDDFTLTEIAYKMHYSSVSHLSKQFKKVTGLAPSHFKRLKNKRRITIQNLANESS